MPRQEVEGIYDRTQEIIKNKAFEAGAESALYGTMPGTWRGFARFTNFYVNPFTGKIEEQSFAGLAIPSTASVVDTANYALGLDFVIPLLFGDGSAERNAHDYVKELIAETKNDLFSKYLSQKPTATLKYKDATGNVLYEVEQWGAPAGMPPFPTP